MARNGTERWWQMGAGILLGWVLIAALIYFDWACSTFFQYLFDVINGIY